MVESLNTENTKKIFLKRTFKERMTCGQSYKAPTIVIYDSRVVPDWKIPHITTLEA